MATGRGLPAAREQRAAAGVVADGSRGRRLRGGFSRGTGVDRVVRVDGTGSWTGPDRSVVLVPIIAVGVGAAARAGRSRAQQQRKRHQEQRHRAGHGVGAHDHSCRSLGRRDGRDHTRATSREVVPVSVSPNPACDTAQWCCNTGCQCSARANSHQPQAKPATTFPSLRPQTTRRFSAKNAKIDLRPTVGQASGRTAPRVVPPLDRSSAATLCLSPRALRYRATTLARPAQQE